MNNILHQIDCNKYMKDIPDHHFDLVIVDPPYGIGVSNHEQIGTSKKHKIKDWDNHIPDIKYFNELRRISGNQIIFGVNYFDGFGLNGGRIIWNKLGTRIGHRKIAPTFSDCEIAYYSGSNNTKMFSYTYIGNVQGNDYKILWSNTNRIHPTQKPVALYKWLLTNYAKPGFKLFDSHSGSGSFRIAAYDMGFDLISCELDTDYCRDNETRFQRHIQQADLFDTEEIQKLTYTQGELS